VLQKRRVFEGDSKRIDTCLSPIHVLCSWENINEKADMEQEFMGKAKLKMCILKDC
jgi:hypothetical protein